MTTTTNWEKEFDKKRPTMELTNSNGEGAINFFGYKYQELDEIHEVTDWGNIKNFIRSLLAQQREELLDLVEKEVISTIDTGEGELFDKNIRQQQRQKLSALRKEGGGKV